VSPTNDFQSIPTRRISRLALLFGLAFMLFFAVGAVYWFIIRVEVDAGQILVLVNKTGRELPAELMHEFGVVLYPELVHAIAAKTNRSDEYVRHHYKGIRYEVLPEGRYFPNPYSFATMKLLATTIQQNEMGVLIRRFGKPLPFPKTVATEPDERGTVADILRPGRHNVNLFAYDVQRFPAIQIPEGHVGVVTLLSGKEPTHKNTFTVEPGEKGVQRETLPPGLEYYNPYLKRIEIVDVRSHKYDMLSHDAIHFPSNDSFTITIEGTIEWAIRPDRVAEVTVSYGDAQDILDKIILPNTRSIARIQGSKLDAREFISGKTRTAFQDKLLSELRSECWQQGVEIRAALVRDIQPPTNEMKEAQSEAMLVEQRELQEQNKAIGDARRKVVTVVKESEQKKGVVITNAQQKLEVAKLQLEAAAKQAQAVVSRGQAEADVVLFHYQARAEPLATAVQAFGSGKTYAQQYFLQRVAPSITSIMTNTEGPFAEIFRQLQTFDAKPASGGKP
jgi:hypothetical protein